MNSQGGLKEKAIIGMGSCGLMVEIRTHNRKVASSSLGPAGIVGGGSKCTAISPHSIPRRGALEQGTEPPTAPWAPQHKWLPTAPGVCSRCVCVCSLLCVCTWMGKCRARIMSMGHHTWLYVISLHFHFNNRCSVWSLVLSSTYRLVFINLPCRL